MGSTQSGMQKLNQSDSSHIASQQNISSRSRYTQSLNANPLFVWNSSLKYDKDLENLIYNESMSLNDWIPQVQSYMKKIKNKQTYQQHCRILLQYCLCDRIHDKQDQIKLRDLFMYYKQRIENSYCSDGQFSQSMLSYCAPRYASQKLLYLYNWSNINEEHIEAFMIQLSPQSFLALQEFVNLIMQQEVFIQNQLHFQKFIIHAESIENSYFYSWQICQKIYHGQQKQFREKQIRQIHQTKQIYIKVARAFLKYNNYQNAQLVMRTLERKKYQLNQQEMNFYLKIKFGQVFTYDLNIFNVSFQIIQHQSPVQLFQMFFNQKSFSQISLLKKCYYIFDDKHKTFLRDLKDYSFCQQCQIEVTLLALQFQLTQQNYQAKDFISKIKSSKSNIFRFQRQILQTLDNLKQQQIKTNLKIILNCCQVLYALGLNISIKQLFIFKEYKYQKQSDNAIQLHELRFLAVACLKNLIGKYFVQDKQKTIKFCNQTFKFCNPTTLLQICLYFQTQLFQNRIIFKNQVHQIIFQHMLYFYRYDQIKELLKEENIKKYQISRQLTQLIIRQNIEETLKADQTTSNSISNSNQQKDTYKASETFQKKEKYIKMQLSLLQDEQKLQNKMVSAFFNILKLLHSYNISLIKQEKQSINVNLLYQLLKRYPERIEVIDFDQIYKNIRIVQNYSDQISIITDQYLKFKFTLANSAFQINKPKFAEKIIQSVVVFQPPWLTSQLIKIFNKNKIVNDSMISLAFQFCSKGQDLLFILKIWIKKINNQKQNPKYTGIKGINLKNGLSLLQSSSQKLVVTNSQCIQNQRQQLYYNLVSQMTFNYQVLTSQKYRLFFILLGTEPDRAFYNLYKYKLNVTIIQIVLREAIKNNIVKFVYTINNLYKVIYLLSLPFKEQNRMNFKQFKLFNTFQKTKCHKIDQSISQNNNVILKSLYSKYSKIIKCFQVLQSPQVFLKTYLQTSNNYSQNSLYMFLFDQNYRAKFFVSLIKQPMGTIHIRTLFNISQELQLKIIDETLQILCDKVNLNPFIQKYDQDQSEVFQHIILKLIIWTFNLQKNAKQIVRKLVNNIFSVKTLIVILQYLKSKENYPNQNAYHSIITMQHIKILKSLANIEINTQYHGIISNNFFDNIVAFRNKANFYQIQLSEQHKKIIKRQIKQRNVLVLSKCMLFFYQMNFNVQCQVLQIFLQESPQSSLKQTIEEKVKMQKRFMKC